MGSVIFIYDSCLVLSCLNIDESYKKGNLVVFVQVLPYIRCEAVDIAFDRHALRLALKARKRISIVHVGVDETSLTA